jgi:hypothetical protein
VSGLANLICFKHKSSLSKKQKKRDTLLELKRDYVQKLHAIDILGPQIGYGVVTDGIEWSFIKIKARRQGRKEEAGLLVCELETVNNVYNGKNYNFQELAKFLTLTFTKSIVESKPSKSPFVNIQEMRMTRNCWRMFSLIITVTSKSPGFLQQNAVLGKCCWSLTTYKASKTVQLLSTWQQDIHRSWYLKTPGSRSTN